MRITFAAAFTALILTIAPGHAGEAEIRSAQASIDGQLKAFLADDDTAAYSFAAPNVKQVFPTLEGFMSMVRSGYPMVHRSSNYSFGKSEETSATRVVQQVFIRGQDGKDYEAVYTLELQPDGQYRITGVSLRASNALST